jgi:hypothetical protein
MTLTPAIKGQLTKALKGGATTGQRIFKARQVFVKQGVPAEQAKHLARKLVS